ncbi:hypothetical protein L5515_008130 [Caenorhabditis briggsae]|uniref:Protein CBR-HPO-22 n=1 Tax=Caenorhabditis briggsae TaxID=6238 RepID=A0AAE9A6D5_CAEBR|nr:hypothetical protein L3Y34_008280 [Caenorhabditis briggsae]UMM35569.1 hypothetical protein L5515_008130 [Caenorhabditis briggsae]
MHQNSLGPATSGIGGNLNTAYPPSQNDCILLQHAQPGREEREIKKIFAIEDGVYQTVKHAEISRPKPLSHYQVPPGLVAAANQMAGASSTVRVSFLDFSSRDVIQPDVAVECSSSYDPNKQDENGSPMMRSQNEENEKSIICFNVGKELYMYAYRGTRTKTDLTRPIDKRVYKGTAPSCHIFNQEKSSASTSQLLIGFTLGQLQIIDPLDKISATPSSKLYNEDRYIEKTAVTCLRFLPGEPNIFLSSHVSGNLYVYDERISAISSSGNGSSQSPPWHVQTQGYGYTTYSWKTKHPRNPTTRWQIGSGTIHQFNFSGPDTKMLATVSHDGFLRIFNYETQELMSCMKSYFGGLLTLAWSPDAKLIATGGEDDLLTVYDVAEKKVVCRGQAHKSWISQVQFDPYVVRRSKKDPESNGRSSMTALDDVSREMDTRCMPSTSTDPNFGYTKPTSTMSRNSLASASVTQRADEIVYRIGSVGHDTFLCLWDITNEILNKGNHRRHRNSTIIATNAALDIDHLSGKLEDLPELSPGVGEPSTNSEQPLLDANRPAPPQEKPPKKKRFNRKAFGLSKFTSSGNASTSTSAVGSRANPTNANASSVDIVARLGSPSCPGIRDVPIIEPLTCKKVSHDRLTVLEFRKDCVVTACQEGFICTWSRPSDRDDVKQDNLSSTAAATPESEQKPSVSATASFGYGSEISNGVTGSRSSSNFSTHELQQLRSPNATSPSYRVGASTSAYHRPMYAWQNAN